MRYQLLLREILRSTERMGDESRAIRGALQVMIEVPQQANDMMNVGRIKDLPTNVHQLGELRLQDMLAVSEPISKETKDVKEVEKKFKERRAFLFQQAMIFCDEIPAKDKYSSPNYIYKYELKVGIQFSSERYAKMLGPSRSINCSIKNSNRTKKHFNSRLWNSMLEIHVVSFANAKMMNSTSYGSPVSARCFNVRWILSQVKTSISDRTKRHRLDCSRGPGIFSLRTLRCLDLVRNEARITSANICRHLSSTLAALVFGKHETVRLIGFFFSFLALINPTAALQKEYVYLPSTVAQSLTVSHWISTSPRSK